MYMCYLYLRNEPVNRFMIYFNLSFGLTGIRLRPQETDTKLCTALA